jgi:hypothetical protein
MIDCPDNHEHPDNHEQNEIIYLEPAQRDLQRLKAFLEVNGEWLEERLDSLFV